ncbi:MAG TPA: energy transducer TonB [Opitutaceae bacterium]|nr:energy transducer TonB [Opitutaceae bacterium]
MNTQLNSRSFFQCLPVLALVALVGLSAPMLRAAEPEAPAPFPVRDPDGPLPDSALPALVHRVEPARPVTPPADEKAERVYVAFVVDADGRVKDPRVMYACAPESERAALSAIVQWRFTAGKLMGRPVSTQMTVALDLPVAPGS